jgi:chemotaxis protein MotA
MDVTTFLGIAFALSCILGGQMLEGGDAGSTLQLAAALIVMGGTTGAVIAQFPTSELWSALRQVGQVFVSQPSDLEPLAKRIVELARKSRREGLLALENEAARSKDPFFTMSLHALVDGSDIVHLRALLDASLEQERHAQEAGPKLLDAAGGYAPTIGILGAVLGLIHVMENLSDPTKLGSGIAVAFVATVYGVGSANLVFLPLAQKLRMKVSRDLRRKEMIMEGVCGIQEGTNPQMLERRLWTYLPLRRKESDRAKSESRSSERAAARAG